MIRYFSIKRGFQILAAVFITLSFGISSGCAHRQTHELLNAVLWVQTAPEYQGTTKAVYQAATNALDDALADSAWTAALEQEGDYSDLPTAVILDLDETVLDNSPFEARMINEDMVFDRDMWGEWVEQKSAEAIPGALEFARYAVSRDVTLFYVTNRDAKLEEATFDNVKNLGLPLDQGRDSILLRNERPEWDRDKSSRRAEVAKTHRILLLLGDDLGDFVPGARSSLAERQKLAQQYDSYWGTKWFALPNPLYGSWEGALYDFERSLSDQEKLRKKYSHLRPY